MATRVYYNGVWMNNVLTKNWSQEIIYDETNTDVVGHRYDLTFEGIVHLQGDGDDTTPSIELQNGGGGDIGEKLIRIRTFLAMARGYLNVLVDDVEILAATGTGFRGTATLGGTMRAQSENDIDVDNGPKPKNIVIDQIVGSELFKLSFSVTCTLYYCPGSTSGLSQTVPDIIANRWSVTEDMDDNYFMTKSINGRLRIPSGREHSPMWWKQLVMPPLETGFKRTRVRMTVAPNGLEAAYEVTDRQVAVSAPYPCTKFEARVEEVASEHGAHWNTHITARAFGAPNAPRKLLLQRCCQFITWKTQLRLGNLVAQKDGWWLPSIRIVEVIGDANFAEASVVIQHLPDTSSNANSTTKKWLSDLQENFGNNPTVETWRAGGGGLDRYDAKDSWAPSTYGYVPLSQLGQGRARETAEMLNRLLYSPCQTTTAGMATNGRTQLSNEMRVATTSDNIQSQEPQVEIAWPSFDERSNLSREAQSSVYTYCRMVSTYDGDNMLVHSPLAASASSQTGSSTLFSLGQPLTQRTLECDAERIGDWPSVPGPREAYEAVAAAGGYGTGSAIGGAANSMFSAFLNQSAAAGFTVYGNNGVVNVKLLKDKVSLLPPVTNADASKQIYRVHVKYVFALSRYPAYLLPGRQPTMETSKAFTEENLDHTLTW